MYKIVSFLLALAFVSVPIGTSAQTAEVTFSIQSLDPSSVQLEFYSQTRNHVWPGHGKAYVIRDWEVHNYTLTCRKGEKICYGAWVDGNPSSGYWGAGYNGSKGCADCCTFCNGGVTTTYRLKP